MGKFLPQLRHRLTQMYHRRHSVSMIRAAALTLALLAAPAHAAPRVFVKDGNVVIENGGSEKQLTKSARDSEPVLSPDGSFVVFNRAPATKPNDKDECHDGAAAENLMRVGADGRGEAVLVRGRTGKTPQQRLCGYTGKQFNSNGRLLYFLTPGWATSGALHVYDFKARAERFVVDASGLVVLRACKNEHKDRVAIMRHKYFAFGGSYDWYWLYDPRTKKEIGPLGEIDEKDLAKQAGDWCG
jgi:hypothetical protein